MKRKKLNSRCRSDKEINSSQGTKLSRTPSRTYFYLLGGCTVEVASFQNYDVVSIHDDVPSPRPANMIAPDFLSSRSEVTVTLCLRLLYIIC
ncbi:unnamed protein product [Amoebophrya sp. A25]|nr:unnamed protein product [Amoebophrya sp. A25]|eukprot:GSA25T00013648001.1